MTVAVKRACSAVLFGWLAASGCSFDRGANDAYGCDPSCPPGRCFMNYCLGGSDHVQNPISGGTGGSTGEGGTGGGTSVGEAGRGEAGTGEAGTGEAGTGEAGTGGAPGCVPEGCNARDDDCDGAVDEALELGSCEAPGQGACGVGLMQCEDGATVCRASAEPSVETCNGLDDDCDGTADEDSDVACYPADTGGCTLRDDGSYACTGLCTAGTRVCQNGELSECTGAVVPRAEECGGEEPADENCDGQVDDTCPCTGEETQRCYTGPRRTAGVGACRVGTQRCQNGLFGPCEGEVTPADERCDNPGVDDNCNGVRDDVPGLGIICFDLRRRGACAIGTWRCSGDALACVTPAPAATETRCDGVDEDCDGPVDEAFDFATDEQHCGGCNWRCPAGTECCGGACVDPNSDRRHCGSCSNACGGQHACCGGRCTQLGTNANCSQCGHVCNGNNVDCCGRECVATNTNANCGGCGISCDTEIGEVCCDGGCTELGTEANCSRCGDACDTEIGEVCCDGGCTELGTEANCSRCGDACDTEIGEVCCGGTCTRIDVDGGVQCPP